MIEAFGTYGNGETVHSITLKDGALSAVILTHGASLQKLHLEPHPFSLVLGFPTLDGYLAIPYFGAMVGRVANRIADGRFVLDGKTIDLDKNENARQILHGGRNGISQRNWQIVDHGEAHVTLTLTDTPEHAGFPGNCDISVTYTLKNNALVVDCRASSDEPTPCNIAHHSYFNLSGEAEILGHELQIAANAYLPINQNKIPTGIIAPVAGTPFDFRQTTGISRQVADQMDHNYCINEGLPPQCRLRSPKSGISMEIETGQPGLQVFMANGLSTLHAGHAGTPYSSYCGIALEPQYWPDAPNHPGFSGFILKPGEEYRETSTFRFLQEAAG